MGRFVFRGAGIFFFLSILINSSSQLLPFREGLPNFSILYPSNPDSIPTDFDDYIWPTDAGRLVSSVFAEYRRSHFHGGIDISTGDDVGFRVFASRSGYVARIVVGPTGYGKMLWLRHADGYYTTYAHLSTFNSAINARVRAEQLRLERFPVTIDCGPTEFPAKKGDVIAFTGESGTGSPHLHFEIRDEKKDFVNPFLCRDFRIDDDSIPRILQVAFVPLTGGSLINGTPAPSIVQITDPIRPHISLQEIVHVSGAIGISVDVRDRINGSRFKNGIYSHRLFIDDSLAYTVKLNRAPSEGDHQVGLYFDHDLMEDYDGRFERLYTPSPNPLHVYSPKTIDAGVLESSRFAEGVHTFKIVTSDYWGNSTEITGSLMFSRPAQYEVSSSQNTLSVLPIHGSRVSEVQISSYSFGSPRSGWRLIATQPVSGTPPHVVDLPSKTPDIIRVVAMNQFGSPSAPQFFVRNSRSRQSMPQLTYSIGEDAVSIHLSTEEAFTSVPSVAVIEGSATQRLTVHPLDYNSYKASFRPNELFPGKRTIIAECEVNKSLRVVADSFTINPILPNRNQLITYDRGNLLIRTDSTSVFKPTFLFVSSIDDGYALRPRNTILNTGLTITVKKSSSDRKQGLYFRSRVSGWRLIATDSGRSYFQTKLTRTLGEISVRRDDRPPVVSRLTLPRRATRPQPISFRVSDSRSGVEYKQLKLYIDEAFVIPEIDGEHRRVTYHFTEPLQRGSHSVRIVVQDRMGNTANIQRVFTVR
ncbi:MAG: peptidoglycan DD-metalloendopeptidase family protein [Ignavibacteriae bacterium]|nr:peptidoglycan DD-metalloendopeptidase family protein [Ignavibacteriota bacterium]